jgi:hypothetical protein
MNSWTTHAGIEADEFCIPNLLPPPLPREDALRLAGVARVPPEKHELFFDLAHMTIALVWMRDIRAVGGDTSNLKRIANAARTLHQELGKLDPLSQKWWEWLWRRTFWYREGIQDVPETVFRLAHMFSTAAGMSPPRGPGVTAPENQKSGRDKTREDVMLLDFVIRLKMVARESGGKLGLDAENKCGTLVEAVKILEPHLPDGFVPKFPFSALKKIKAETLVRPISEIDFYSVEPPA